MRIPPILVLVFFGVSLLSTEPGQCSTTLVAYYTFDDGTIGQDAVIISDSGPNNLIGIAGQAGTNANPEYSPGFNGASLRFLGQFGDSFVQVPDPGTYPLDLTGPHTIEAYICPDSTNVGQAIIRKFGGLGGNDGGPGGYALSLTSTGQVAYMLFDDDFTLLSNSVLSPGELHHVAATWDGVLMRLYIDYQLDAAMVYTGNLQANNSQFGIGALLRDNGTIGQTFRGKIDEVRITAKILDPEDFIQVVPADSVNLVLGTNTAGELADTYISDDVRFEITSGAPLSVTSPSIWLDFETTLPIDDPVNLVFAIESQVTDIGVSQRVEFFNFDTNQYEQIDQRPKNINNESTAKIIVQGDVLRFIQAGTGIVRTRVTYTSNGTGFFASWKALIDQITWMVH